MPDFAWFHSLRRCGSVGHGSIFRVVPTILLVLLSMCSTARGQAVAPDASCGEAHTQQMRDGVAALDEEALETAIRILREVVDEVPGCSTRAHGAAAYWLGVAYERAGRVADMREAWAQGIDRLLSPDAPFDVRLADAYIRHVFSEEQGAHFETGARAYLRLLEHADQPVTERNAAVLRQHLRLVAQVLPARERERLGLSLPVTASTVTAMPKGGGERLAAWWRGQDPLPATAANERLEEHLKRVAYAQNHFQTDGRIDDRGLVYVRLGPPSRQTTIRFSSIRFNQTVLSFSSRFSATDFRSGEFWVYDHVSRATQYLFVEVNRDVFEVGDVLSMLPSELQRGFSSTQRGREEAAAFIRSLEEAYGQLAVYHDRYHTQYQQLSSYSLDLDRGSSRSVIRGNRGVLDFARRTLSRVKEADAYHQRQREAKTPLAYSDDTSDYASIPVAVRHARFLRENGTTEVEVFWSAPYSGLSPDEQSTADGDYLLNTSLVQRKGDGRRVVTQRMSSTLQVEKTTGRGFLTPQTHQFRVDRGQSFRFGMQWSQYEAASVDEQPKPGKMIGRHVYQSDTLYALDADDANLQVSDLRPMVVTGDDPEATLVDEALPYPFHSLSPQTPLALYFEVYHLTFGADEQTRYTIDYQIERRTERGGLVGLLGGDDAQQTTTQTTHEGERRRTEEYLILDLGEWEGDGTLQITVRVTDEVSGQTVERDVVFNSQ